MADIQRSHAHVRRVGALAAWVCLLWSRHVPADTGNPFIRPDTPVYKYELVLNHNADVCKHMQQVLNRQFAHLWDSGPEELYDPKADQSSLPALFPPLAGVEQTKELALTVRYSRYPSSPEFDAIPWRIGKDQVGTKADGTSMWLPMLIAHFDLDNDGHIDTVAKVGFTRGYGELMNPHDSGNLEYLNVWRSQPDAEITWDPTALEKMAVEDRPALLSGAYIRPFVYKERTYLARYAFRKKPNGESAGEWMLIDELRYDGSLDPIFTVLKRPALRETSLCRLRMIDTRNRPQS